MRTAWWRLLFAVGVLGLSGALSSAHAQGPIPQPCSYCSTANTSIGQIAANMQQGSFSGIQSIMQYRRDQLQRQNKPPAGTPPQNPRRSSIDIDESFRALAYADSAAPADPLAAYARATPRAPMPSGPSVAAWIQGTADRERDDALSATDFRRHVTVLSTQGGVDWTWQRMAAADDAFLFGVLASWTDSQTAYTGLNTTLGMSGPGVGLYMTYVKGGFSVDVAPKFDFLHMTQEFGGAFAARQVDLTNVGAAANVQYKFDMPDNSFIEPTAGLAYTRTMFDGSAAAFGIRDATTFRVQAGARIGTQFSMNSVGVEPSLKALIYSNVVADNTNLLATGVNTPTDKGLARGELDPAVTFDFGNGYSVSLLGQLRFGEALLGGNGSVSFRKQF